MVPDPHETGGHHVQQEAADEVGRWQCRALPVAGGDGDRVAGDGEHAMVGDGDAVGVASEVGEDVIGSGEGPLGVDDPRLREQCRAQLGEVPCWCGGPAQVEGLAAVEPLQRGQAFPAEERRQDRDGEEEPAAGVDPAGGVGCQATGRHDVVQVGMEAQVTGPGVKHRGDAEQRAEALGVKTEFEEGLCNGGEQDVEEGLPIAGALA